MHGSDATTLTRRGPLTAAVDAMEDSYVEWREHADALAHAFSRWAGAPPAEQEGRFAAYVAMLDQEEAAAADYAARVRDTRRLLNDSAADARR
jgi:hypothetical protein